jgi:hypothetical protein
LRLEVKVVDIAGHSGSARLYFIYDNPPTLDLGSLNEGLARPSISIDVKCPEKPCEIYIRSNDISGLANGVNEVVTDLDLSAWEGSSLELLVYEYDSRNQVTLYDLKSMLNQALSEKGRRRKRPCGRFRR